MGVGKMDSLPSLREVQQRLANGTMTKEERTKLLAEVYKQMGATPKPRTIDPHKKVRFVDEHGDEL